MKKLNLEQAIFVGETLDLNMWIQYNQNNFTIQCDEREADWKVFREPAAGVSR